MPARIRRSFSSRRRFPRRKVQWADFQVDIPTTSLAIGQYQNVDLLSGYRAMPGSEAAGITVMRVHLRTWVTSAVVVGDGLISALIVDDMGELTSSTYALHVTVNPVTQPYVPWMMYQRQNAHPGYSFTSPNNQWEWDIKSRRKVDLGQTLIYHIGNFDASAAQSVSIHARTLLALS